MGGSLALFLGFSYLSGVELIFYVLEFVIEAFMVFVEFIMWHSSSRVHPFKLIAPSCYEIIQLHYN